jgi:hypothetical protein
MIRTTISSAATALLFAACIEALRSAALPSAGAAKGAAEKRLHDHLREHDLVDLGLDDLVHHGHF